MKNIIILLAFLAFCNVNAQMFSVTGKITDNSKQSLPGVNVAVKGTTRGTTSDFDGEYTIKVSRGEVLVFSYVGFLTKEIKVKNTTVINVVLEEDIQSLDEVVTV